MYSHLQLDTKNFPPHVPSQTDATDDTIRIKINIHRPPCLIDRDNAQTIYQGSVRVPKKSVTNPAMYS